MRYTVRGLWNGTGFVPDEPLPLAPGTRVEVTVLAVEETESGVRKTSTPVSFMDVAHASQLKGPSDWSERVDYYLYGEMVDES
jgi:hypothetical protein